MGKRWIVCVLAGAAVAATLSAQPPGRRATNVAALLAHSAFYHQRPVVIVGNLVRREGGDLRIVDDTGSLKILFRRGAPSGLSEIRGAFWDVGRMNSDDPRLARYDLSATFGIDPEAGWPRPGDVTAVIATAIAPATPPPTPSIRAVVLFSDRYFGQKVTIIGQFAGRNLLGDLPDAPAISPYDFVLRSADGAVWVANARPQGKGFDLALDARLDTGRWLEVTGTLRQGRGLQWIDADSLKLSTPPDERADETPVQLPPAPPPEVSFSVPIEGETDVQRSTSVRIQFSRDIDPATLRNRIRVAYLASEEMTRGEPISPGIEFTTRYRAGTRVLEILFGNPLEQFRPVRVELLEGILGTDRQPLQPWTLTFSSGGS